MTTRRPSKLGSLVGCFEQTIAKNRENGHDKDLLGRTSVPGSKVCATTGRVRRHTMSFSPRPKANGGTKKLRQVSLLVKATNTCNTIHLSKPQCTEPETTVATTQTITCNSTSSSSPPNHVSLTDHHKHVDKVLKKPANSKPLSMRSDGGSQITTTNANKPGESDVSPQVEPSVTPIEKLAKAIPPSNYTAVCRPPHASLDGQEEASDQDSYKKTDCKQDTHSFTLKTTAPPTAPPHCPSLSRAPKIESEEDNMFEQDDDIQALQRRIAELEGKLKQSSKDEETELLAVEQDKVERKARFRQEQRTKLGLPSEKEAALRALANMELGHKVQENRDTIEHLRQSNKTLRLARHSLAEKIVSFQENNSKLESETASCQQVYEQLSAFRDSEEKTYDGFLSSMPRYRHKIEKLRTEVEKRDSLIQMERKASRSYDSCLRKILVQMKAQCGDSEMNVEVVAPRTMIGARRQSAKV
ncbi:expressed unknown protein [Seminavis robusta]|uniref:Uncharacterized protein n=1 Tax=Seminavis robusta TaxID=568900 RepID=A0A9N8E656_9STRA|nr:expressed unknown protein [Seminavis robusta]|eukprot:Sro556_g165870.1 n/a (471) ;mRNA; r:3280-4692